jgi:hypothetical protein
MPKGIDWIHFIYINLAFIALIFSMFFFASITEIKKDWPKYRCNPMFMPLSDNIQADFTFCVQNMQNNYMGYLLEPLTYITSNLTEMGGQFTDSLNFFRVMISNIRTFMASITGNIYGVFLNLIIEFQKITIGIKDLVGKLIGILVTLMYIMEGSIKTMQATWNGPPGQMVQALCFHPDTEVKLRGGKVLLMKDLNLGDVLENGSRVNATIKLDNSESKMDFYVIPNGVNGKDIYVTGSHMIFSKERGKYIEVRSHPEAKKQDHKKSDWFSCLITSDHKIQLGEHTFCDWDDDLVRPFTPLCI